MNDNLARRVADLENVIFVCFGQPEEDDLPQIGDEDSVIVDLMQYASGKSHQSVEIELNHQFDPSSERN